MRPRILVGVFGVALTLTGGCKHEGHEYAAADAEKVDASNAVVPSGLMWEDSKLVVTGMPNAHGYLRDEDKTPFSLRASFHGFPVGTTIDIGRESYSIGDAGSFERLIDVGAELGQAEFHAVFDTPWPLNVSIAVTFPGAKTFSEKVPPQNQYATKRMLAAGFASVREGPVIFTNEPAAPAKARNVFFVPHPIGIADPEIIGTIKQVNDVDRVAIEKHALTETTIHCHGLKRTTDQKGSDEALIVRLVNSEVQIFDRRTGKVAATKLFAASKDCPVFALGNKGEEAKTYPSKDAIKEWLRASLRK